MRKTIVVLLVAVLVSCLCACSKGKTPSSDTSTKITSEMSRYVGKWVKEPYTNPQTGIVYDNVLYLYEDGTGKRTSTPSEGYSKAEYGIWYIEEGRIVLDITKVIGEDDFDPENPWYGEHEHTLGTYRGFYEITGTYSIKDYTKEY